MDTVSIDVADLDGPSLGQESGDVVLLDLDAAGYGWFVDRTPNNDIEFQLAGGILTACNAQSEGRMDLLSVVSHELGHVAGLDHQPTGVMASTLAVGTRSLAPEQPGSANRSPAARAGFAGVSDDSARRGLEDLRLITGVAPNIDWSSDRLPSTDPKKNHPASGSAWVDDFVNHLGQTEAQRSPNAALRFEVHGASRASSSVTHNLILLSGR
jgi:hypothetical protein